MSIIPLNLLINMFFFLLIANIVCLIVALFLHLILPKSIEKEFFREPYFSSQFIAISNSFPMNYYKVFMFMRLAGWPNCGKKRGIPATAGELCPVWFQVLSRVFIRMFLAIIALFFVSLIILLMKFKALGIM